MCEDIKKSSLIFWEGAQGKVEARLKTQVNYYVYGLRIAGISSKAMSSSLNPNLINYGYSGSFAEEVEDFGLGYNEFFLRNYDPQIGRWTTTDPYDEFPSPYIGMGNNPVNFTYPTGGFLGLSPIMSTVVATAGGAMVGGLIDVICGSDGTKGMLIGGATGLVSGVALSMLSSTGSSVATLARVTSAAIAINSTSAIPASVSILPILDATGVPPTNVPSGGSYPLIGDDFQNFN